MSAVYVTCFTNHNAARSAGAAAGLALGARVEIERMVILGMTSSG